MFNRCKNRAKWNKWPNINQNQVGDGTVIVHWQILSACCLLNNSSGRLGAANTTAASCQNLAVYRKACSRTFSSCFRLLLKCFYPISLLGNIFPFRFSHFVFHWRFSVIFTVPSHSSCILKRAILISCDHFAFVIHFHDGSGRKERTALNMKLQ